MNKRKLTQIAAGATLLLAFASALPAQPQTVRENSADIAAMRASQEQMQQTIERLNARIDQLEREKSAPPAPTTVRIQENITTNTNLAPPSIPEPQVSGGWIAVPQTGLKIQFNVKPRLDMSYDNRYSGNDDRFVTAQIPTEGTSDYDSSGHFGMNMRGSQLKFDVRPIDESNNFRLYYENDFFAGGNSGGMDLRLRQLYAQFGRFTFGFTYSSFEDPDIWPDTVDYEGPNAAIFARWPLVRYSQPLTEGLTLNLSVEKPDTQIDSTNVSEYDAKNRMPDFAGNLRWEVAKGSHIQFSGVLRDISADGSIYGRNDNQSVLGWGVNVSGVFQLSPNDKLQVAGTYGDGLFRYANDNFMNNDAAYSATGELRAITYQSALFGYTHRWSDQWRSTASYGWVKLDNKHSQDAIAYHVTNYASLNLVYTPLPRLDVGAEVLYGQKEVKDGSDGDVWRLQVSCVYSLF